MTTSLDTKIRPKVRDAINTYGVTATLITYSDSYTESSGKGVRTGTSTSVKVTPLSRVRQEIQIGTEMYVSTAQCLLAAMGLSVTPQRQDQLTFGQTWEIIEVLPLYSGDLVAAWKLFLYGE